MTLFCHKKEGDIRQSETFLTQGPRMSTNATRYARKRSGNPMRKGGYVDPNDTPTLVDGQQARGNVRNVQNPASQLQGDNGSLALRKGGWEGGWGRAGPLVKPQEEVEAIASKGGQSSHQGGFASMNPDKEREIASQGGKASSGSFEPGSEKAREAGQKGGSK
ncbi:hypothetical protein HIM_09102 [Hirsutella minnesotensis 3608]|uniref:Conidiation-specific protein 10 n=1 Tax=Hirsutella minnesotensis 3608 TaxID=1043627 RepID=A0A0F8A3B0_9HYPO|nr:hypothetical protein HIM_09102 [Hirsutella minnesotensis 3608]